MTWALSGGDGIRTHGLYIANVALCQLSYTPDERTGYLIVPVFRKCGVIAVDAARSAAGGRSTLGKGLEALDGDVLVLVPRPGEARLGGPGHHVRPVVLDGHRLVLSSS